MTAQTGDFERQVVEVSKPRKTLNGWRWGVAIQRPVEGVHPGVYDARQHPDSAFGYTRTRVGAWLNIVREVAR